jgi:hypothetical protein
VIQNEEMQGPQQEEPKAPGGRSGYRGSGQLLGEWLGLMPCSTEGPMTLALPGASSRRLTWLQSHRHSQQVKEL